MVHTRGHLQSLLPHATLWPPLGKRFKGSPPNSHNFKWYEIGLKKKKSFSTCCPSPFPYVPSHPFSKSDSATLDLLLKAWIFSIFVEWGQAGSQQLQSQKKQIQQQQPSCPLCGTYYQLLVNTGSWLLKMETNKPGILTKPRNNGGVVPALHSFMLGCWKEKGASISLNVSLQHVLCTSTLELCFDLEKGLCPSPVAPF